jgi:hypothetical protein
MTLNVHEIIEKMNLGKLVLHYQAEKKLFCCHIFCVNGRRIVFLVVLAVATHMLELFLRLDPCFAVFWDWRHKYTFANVEHRSL